MLQKLTKYMPVLNDGRNEQIMMYGGLQKEHQYDNC